MRLRWTILAVSGLVLSLNGCSDSGDSARSELSVVSLNGEADASFRPLFSDLVNLGFDLVPYVVEDAVGVVIRNDPKDGVVSLQPRRPFGKVTLTRYTVAFASEENLPPHEGAMHLDIPTGQQLGAVVTIVPAVMKTREPLLSFLLAGGELVANATVTFYGFEDTSGEEVTVRAFLPVHFANWSD
jgi:hypothetical protein